MENPSSRRVFGFPRRIPRYPRSHQLHNVWGTWVRYAHARFGWLASLRRKAGAGKTQSLRTPLHSSLDDPAAAPGKNDEQGDD
jgi:hypothetical protein